MNSRIRMLIYSSIGLPMMAIIVTAVFVDQEQRGGFFADYTRTLGRMVAGEWDLDELTEPQRRHPQSFGGRSNWRRSAETIFSELDRDDDSVLESSELGNVLTQRYQQEHGQSPVALTAKQFQSFLNGGGQRTDTPLVVGDQQHRESTKDQTSRLDADDLFQSGHVAIVDVQINDLDWNKLCNQVRDSRSAFANPLAKPYTYFKANVTVDGVEIQNVGIRKKGFIGSQDRIRPSLKIQFDEYEKKDPVEGLDRLTLNNNRQDHALVSQYLTYQIFNRAGVPAPRSAFAAVTVNGKYLGVYTHVESVKQPFLDRVFPESSGDLYEGTLTDLYPKSIEWFEAKTKATDAEGTRLLALSEILHDDSATLEDIESFVDLDRFLSYWCVESLINFWDGYTKNQNNYFIYDNPADGKMLFMPWGADSCFGNSPRFVRWGASQSNAVHASSILANRLYHFSSIQARYKKTMTSVLRDVWHEDHLLRECDRLQDLLIDYVDREQINFVVAMDDLREFVRRRRELVMNELTDNWPAEVSPNPKPTMYKEVVGTSQGVFLVARNEDGEGVEIKHLDAHFESADTLVQFDSMNVYGLPKFLENVLSGFTAFTFEGIRDARPFELRLTAAEPVKKTENGVKARVQGEISDQNYSRWQQIEIRGTLKLLDLDDSVEGEFEIELVETRGRRR